MTIPASGRSTLYETTPRSPSARAYVRYIATIVLVAAFFGGAALLGPEFVLAEWPAWLVAALFGVTLLLIVLQRNRFGVYAGAIAPPYKPWGMLSRRRLLIEKAQIESCAVHEVADPSANAADRALYFAYEIRLRSGKTIRFPSHSGFRSLQSQLHSDREILKARDALTEFAVANHLLR